MRILVGPKYSRRGVKRNPHITLKRSEIFRQFTTFDHLRAILGGDPCLHFLPYMTSKLTLVSLLAVSPFISGNQYGAHDAGGGHGRWTIVDPAKTGARNHNIAVIG
jgi:hypothetical protein